MPGPLEGIKVVDMTQVIAGPLACMLLSDLGAEVTKVEPPAFGDLTRLAQFAKGGLNSSVISNNRGKRSIQVDIQKPAGRDLVLEMIKDADVVVQNMRPGVMERLGVGWEGSSAVNPGIVYCSMSGYGATGPYADRAVYDPVIQAMAGYVALQVNPQVPIPDLVRNGVVDKAAAWMAALAITSALFARDEGKGGQHIELSMLDIAIPPSFRLSEIYTLSECADGHLVYFVISDDQFQGLFTALGHPEWMETYGDARERHEKREELGARLGAAFLEWKLADLLPRMHENSVPCGHVNQMEDLPTDPQIVHSGTFVEWDHETAGRIRSPRMSATFSATPPEFKATAPLLNEHVDEVLTEIGITADQRQALLDAGVIRRPED